MLSSVAVLILDLLVMIREETTNKTNMIPPETFPAFLVVSLNQTVENFEECQNLFFEHKEEILRSIGKVTGRMITGNITRIEFKESNSSSEACLVLA